MRNAVIALDRTLHQRVSALQRAIDARAQTPIENIEANMAILRELQVAPPDVLDELERLARLHAQNYGFNP